MFQSGFLDKKNTVDAVKEAASLPSTGADAKSAKKKLQEAFGHQPDVKLDSLVSNMADEDASPADVSRMLGMPPPPPPPPHGEPLEADTDLVVRPSSRLQSRGQAGQRMDRIPSTLQEEPPAEQASDTRLVAGVPQAQPSPETGEQRAAKEPATLASFRQWRQRPQSWRQFQAERAAPDGASSDWGALAAGHGNRLMQLAQEAKRSSLAGPEQASAGLASQKINTPDSSRRHGVNLRASRFNDSDSDEWADPEGSFLAGLPGARGGLPGQLHVSKPAQRRKLRSISRQQAQRNLTSSDSDEVREVPDFTDEELRFFYRDVSPPSSFDSAASKVDAGADPSSPFSVAEDSIDRFVDGCCRPPSLPSVPSSPRDTEEPSTAVSAFQPAEAPLQLESDEEIDVNGERIVHLDPWGRTVKKDAFGWWKRKHGTRLVVVPVSAQRQMVQELRHGKPRPPPATPDEVEVEKLRRLGNKLNRQGKHKEALGAYLKAHSLQPKNARLLAGLAAIYVHLGKWNAAEKSANQAEEIDPDELNLYWWRHLAQVEQGNLQAALEDLVQIMLKPRNYQERGHFYLAFDKYKVLRKDFMQQLNVRNNALDQTTAFTIINPSGSTDEAEYFKKLLDLERSPGWSSSRAPTAALLKELLGNDDKLERLRRREKEAARLKQGDPMFAKGIEPLERELREAERRSPAFLKRHQQALRDHSSAEWDPLNSLPVATPEDSTEDDIDRYIKTLDLKGSSGLL